VDEYGVTDGVQYVDTPEAHTVLSIHPGTPCIVGLNVIFATHYVNLLEHKLLLEITFSAEREFDILVLSQCSLLETCRTGTSVRQCRHFAERCLTCKLLRQETNGNSAVGFTDKQLNFKGRCRCPVRRRLVL